MTLTIAILGTPRISVGGRPLEVDTRKAIALVAYLAATGRPQSRDRLAALLWPDADDQRARATLRRTISTLKTALGGDWLVVDRATVSLDTTGAELDIARFRELAATPAEAGDAIDRLMAAVTLHRDDLLAGFALRDSAEFDLWQSATAVELRRELASALDRLVVALARAGRHDEAIAQARRRLALDALDEPAHRRLIELLAATGRRAEALGQYRTCVRVLDRELGVRPLPETTELYHAINEGRVAAAADAAAPLVEARPAHTLVGRSAQWQRLLAAYGAAGNQGRLVVLEGEAGIGKTRLADELLAHARRGGSLAVGARAHQGEESLPYRLVGDALRGALGERGDEAPLAVEPALLAEAARLVPGLGAAAPRASGPGARQRFYEGVVQVLVAALAGTAPGVLVIDDVQWADRASLDVLAYLGRRLASHPLLVVLAWRTGETEPDRSLRAGAERVALERLTRSDVGTLADAAGVPAAADALYRESEGLPLFVVEYLTGLAAGAVGETMPAGVRELLTTRIERVGETAGQLLAAAAVLGRSFDLDTLRETSGRSDDEVVAGLEELSARAIVRELADRYDFTHDKLRELAVERTSLARRRLLHRRAADALAARGGEPAEIALHRLGAGQAAEAALAYRDAAARARALFAYAETLAHLEQALALDAPGQADLHEAIGDIQTLRGEYRLALAAYETAAALTSGSGLAAIEHKLGRVHDRRGEWDLADRHFEVALELGGESSRVYADRSLAARHRGDDARALELAERALGLAEGTDDGEALAQAHNIVGMLRRDREQLERSVALAARLPDPSVAVAALNNLALACARDGETARALALAGEALTRCIRQGDRHREAALHGNLADILRGAGRGDEAMAELKLAAAGFAEIGRDAAELQPAVWMLVEW